jgi:hypothetical protein
VVATVRHAGSLVDACHVTLTAGTGHAHLGRRRRALWRLDPSGRHPRGYARRDGCRLEPEDFELCLALLDEAIARAERWLACRERVLADFDVRAVDVVRRLRIAGMVAPSTTWDSREEDAART